MRDRGHRACRGSPLRPSRPSRPGVWLIHSSSSPARRSGRVLGRQRIVLADDARGGFLCLLRSATDPVDPLHATFTMHPDLGRALWSLMRGYRRRPPGDSARLARTGARTRRALLGNLCRIACSLFADEPCREAGGAEGRGRGPSSAAIVGRRGPALSRHGRPPRLHLG